MEKQFTSWQRAIAIEIRDRYFRLKAGPSSNESRHRHVSLFRSTAALAYALYVDLKSHGQPHCSVRGHESRASSAGCLPASRASSAIQQHATAAHHRRESVDWSLSAGWSPQPNSSHEYAVREWF